MMTKFSFITMGWQQTSESCLTNQIQVRSTNILPMLNIWKKEVTTPSQCLLFPLSSFSHIWECFALCGSAWHSTFEWKTGARQHPTGRDTETKPKSLCMASALGSRRFGLGYTNVPRPQVSVTQTCTITKRRPSSEPCISVRWGYLDLLSACCLCDGF